MLPYHFPVDAKGVDGIRCAINRQLQAPGMAAGRIERLRVEPSRQLPGTVHCGFPVALQQYLEIVVDVHMHLAVPALIHRHHGPAGRYLIRHVLAVNQEFHRQLLATAQQHLALVENPLRIKQIGFQLAHQGAIHDLGLDGGQVRFQLHGCSVPAHPLAVLLPQQAHEGSQGTKGLAPVRRAEPVQYQATIAMMQGAASGGIDTAQRDYYR